MSQDLIKLTLARGIFTGQPTLVNPRLVAQLVPASTGTEVVMAGESDGIFVQEDIDLVARLVQSPPKRKRVNNR